MHRLRRELLLKQIEVIGIKLKTIVLSEQPSMGEYELIINENIEGNIQDGSFISLSEGLDNGVYHTGGNILSVTGGIELTFNKVTLGMNIQAPIKQNTAVEQLNLQSKGRLT